MRRFRTFARRRGSAQVDPKPTLPAGGGHGWITNRAHLDGDGERPVEKGCKRSSTSLQSLETCDLMIPDSPIASNPPGGHAQHRDGLVDYTASWKWRMLSCLHQVDRLLRRRA